MQCLTYKRLKHTLKNTLQSNTQDKNMPSLMNGYAGLLRQVYLNLVQLKAPAWV